MRTAKNSNTAPLALLKLVADTYVLRVSGKGDVKGARGQLDVLREYESRPDVRKFLATFDACMMSASSKPGKALRRKWERDGRLRVLSRAGRQDFLGVVVTVGRSRFFVYASSAAKMDEANSNAFTRLLIEAIADPTFNGSGDPSYQRDLDAGAFGEHQAVLHAFDPTRFIRSQKNASDLWDAARTHQVALDTGTFFFDPAGGQQAQLMWMFVAFGSEMEAEVGKVRRLVGRLNIARSGRWPYPAAGAPLGFAALDCPDERGRRLEVDAAQVAAVQDLVRLGLDPSVTNAQIVSMLAQQHGIVSAQPTTFGRLVDELNSSAARRFFVRSKLEAYRDGELALDFIGAVQNILQVGSGHKLARRWEGHGGPNNEPDRYGSITYRIPAPKPTVSGPDGVPRSGWLEGLTADQERGTWNRLIVLRGVDDQGRRLLDETPGMPEVKLSDEEQSRLRKDRNRRDAQVRGGHKPQRAIAYAFQPYTGDDEGLGPRYWLRSQGKSTKRTYGAYCQLRCEVERADGGISRSPEHSVAVAAFREQEVTAALGDAILAAVQSATARGHHIGVLDVPELLAAVSSTVDVGEDLGEAQTKLQDAKDLAEGYDLLLARLLGAHPAASPVQIASAETRSQQAWADVALAREQFEWASVPTQDEPDPVAPVKVDVTDVRDVVVALRTDYSVGDVPEGFGRALRTLLPDGFKFEPAANDLTWQVTAAVVLPVVGSGTLTITATSGKLLNVAGRAAGGKAQARTWLMLERRLRDGVTLDDLVREVESVDPAGLRRTLTRALRDCGALADDDRVRLVLDNAIPECTRIVWAAIDDQPVAPGAFADHIREVYLSGSSVSSASQDWTSAIRRDQRLDQIAVLTHARDLQAGLTAAGLGSIVGSYRHVLDASGDRERGGRVLFPATARTPLPEFPHGWYGEDVGALDRDRKRIRLVACPYDDCPESWATAYVPVFEVAVLGAAALCRQCRRAATPPSDPRHAQAAKVVFPQTYIDWCDAHPRPAGHVTNCAGAGCHVDVGFGPGLTWAWDSDDADPRVWHDDACRRGDLLSLTTACRWVDCTLDEGAGPGRIAQAGKGRRAYHGNDCRNAQTRRTRAMARLA